MQFVSLANLFFQKWRKHLII